MSIVALVVAQSCLTRIHAQPPHSDGLVRPAVSINAADNATLAHLDRFDALLDEEQLHEAIETIRQLAETDSEQLVQVPGAPGQSFRRHIPLSLYCQLKLTELAITKPAALTLYRQQADPAALLLLDEGLDRGNVSALNQLITKYFASSHSAQALMRLGAVALERGEWTEARYYWERTSSLTRFPAHNDPQFLLFAGQPTWLITRHFQSDAEWNNTLPLLASQDAAPNWIASCDSKIPQVDVQARLALVSILEGNDERASAEIELLRRRFLDAVGELGGKQGRYVDLLQQLHDESRRWPALEHDRTWTTFAGLSQRRHIAGNEIDLANKANWQIALPTYSGEGELVGSEGTRVAESLDGLLSYFPIVVDDTVVLQAGAAENDLVARRIADGGVVSGAEEFMTDTLAAPGLKRSVGVPRFPLSSYGSTVYARIGSLPTGVSVDSRQEREQPARIVGFDLQAEGRRVIEVQLEGPNWDGDWAFDGVPVSDGDSLYIVLRHRTSVRSEHHVGCFDSRSGRLRWRKMIAGAEPVGVERSFELTHTLLTLRNRTLYCNTNLGVVAAIDTKDGSTKWMTEYPRVDIHEENPDRESRNLFRDLNPCLLHDDLVIVAPTDCDRIFALDANTGIVIWATARDRAADAVHLLGVGQGNLLASGDYLYWFDVYTGRLLSQFPAPQRSLPGLAKPSPTGFGRGILAEKHVYWPTRESILVFDQQVLADRIGRIPKIVREIDLMSRGATGGNLVATSHYLLIAAEDRLVVFSTNGNTSESE